MGTTAIKDGDDLDQIKTLMEQLQQATAAGDEDHEIAMIRRQEEAEKAKAAQILSRAQGRDNASER